MCNVWGNEQLLTGKTRWVWPFQPRRAKAENKCHCPAPTHRGDQCSGSRKNFQWGQRDQNTFSGSTTPLGKCKKKVVRHSVYESQGLDTATKSHPFLNAEHETIITILQQFEMISPLLTKLNRPKRFFPTWGSKTNACVRRYIFIKWDTRKLFRMQENCFKKGPIKSNLLFEWAIWIWTIVYLPTAIA